MKGKNRLIFWGASGQAIALEEFLSKNHKIEVIFDNNKDVKSPFKDIEIYYGKSGFMKWLSKKKKDYSFIVTIGGDKGKNRVLISKYLIKNKLTPFSAINKNSNIANNVTLGDGVQIMMGVSIGAKCKIGNYVILNTSSSIDHECNIAEGCHIAPGATLAGKISVDKYSFIGTGAVLLPNIKIGKECVIGAGSVVTKNVPDFSLVYGNPAKIKGKTNE
jgi:sugar O-acyltransferase (sialic acid O-acetyltransferase NeuD family)